MTTQLYTIGAVHTVASLIEFTDNLIVKTLSGQYNPDKINTKSLFLKYPFISRIRKS